MKILNKFVMVNFEHEITIGDGSIKATLEHQACINEKNIDIDFIDVRDIYFMGIPVTMYYSDFKKKMMEMGIDIDKMIDEEEAKIITPKLKAKLKALWKY